MSTATLDRPAAVVRSVPVRLTRRGRVLLLFVLAAALTVLVTVGQAAITQAGPGGEPVAPLGVTRVEAGETLWALAQRIAPDRDPREVVAQIRELNGMDSSMLQVGQQLLLPVPA